MTRSPLFQLPTRRRLAQLLGFKLSTLEKLIESREQNYWYKEELIANKVRKIARPFGAMDKTHAILANLLNRVEQPNWLSSPRRNMTTVRNAAKHLGAARLTSLDIKKFYPSTTDEHVFKLFHFGFEMPDDVAGMLTKLVTVHARVPFGSPLSPILCAIVHRELFDEVEQLCITHDAIATVWVDDVVVSGSDISDKLEFQIKGAIKKRQLNYHKVHRRRAKRGLVVTGVHVSANGLAPANKLHKKMRDGMVELNNASSSDDKLRLLRSLIGLNVHMASIYDEGDARKQRLLKQRQWLHNERRRTERLLEKCPSPENCEARHALVSQRPPF